MDRGSSSSKSAWRANRNAHSPPERNKDAHTTAPISFELTRPNPRQSESRNVLAGDYQASGRAKGGLWQPRREPARDSERDSGRDLTRNLTRDSGRDYTKEPVMELRESDRDRDKDRDRYRDGGRGKERDKDNGRDRDNDRGRDKSTDKGKDRGKDKGKDSARKRKTSYADNDNAERRDLEPSPKRKKDEPRRDKDGDRRDRDRDNDWRERSSSSDLPSHRPRNNDDRDKRDRNHRHDSTAVPKLVNRYLSEDLEPTSLRGSQTERGGSTERRTSQTGRRNSNDLQSSKLRRGNSSERMSSQTGRGNSNERSSYPTQRGGQQSKDASRPASSTPPDAFDSWSTNISSRIHGRTARTDSVSSRDNRNQQRDASFASRTQSHLSRTETVPPPFKEPRELQQQRDTNIPNRTQSSRTEGIPPPPPREPREPRDQRANQDRRRNADFSVEDSSASGARGAQMHGATYPQDARWHDHSLESSGSYHSLNAMESASRQTAYVPNFSQMALVPPPPPPPPSLPPLPGPPNASNFYPHQTSYPQTYIQTQHGYISSQMPNVPPPPQLNSPSVPPTPEALADALFTEKSDLGKYFRGNQVGEGTYGKVYKGICKSTGALVAMKRIIIDSERMPPRERDRKEPPPPRYEGLQITTMREIVHLKRLQRLKHPNVVELRDIFNGRKGDLYMVFEYMESDLVGLMSHEGLDLKEHHIKCLMKQLFDGLRVLHEQGLVHRDLKGISELFAFFRAQSIDQFLLGSNLLLNKKGELKIADFGLARILKSNRAVLKRLEEYTNRVITLWYRCPELLCGADHYGPEVDMWSAGYVEFCFMIFFTVTNESDNVLVASCSSFSLKSLHFKPKQRLSNSA